MPLSSQAESLDTEEELLGSPGAKAGTQVTENLNTGADDEGDGAKSIVELQAVVARRWLVELGESSGVLSPVKLAAIDNDTADGGTMATNPLGSRVDDNIRAVVNWSDEVAASSKSVVNLINPIFNFFLLLLF
jgi:hypothetical protein